MGKEVENILTMRNHEVVCRIDPDKGKGDSTEVKAELLKKADSVIEFSQPQGVLPNARLYSDAGIPAVVGTTGWEKEREDVKKIILKGRTGYLWGNNFSLGAHLFYALVERAAELYNLCESYDLLAYEIHHNQKKDSPSGTALTMAKRILEKTDRKRKIVTERLDRQILPEELHLASIRGGSVPGTHTVMLDSPADTIEVTHKARNRSGFALGAVMAAEWIIGREGFFQIEEFINDFLKGGEGR